jgi:hypothetical protein
MAAVAEQVAGSASPLETARIAAISGEPTVEEVAAIMAAVEVAWPKPVAAPAFRSEPSRWRFSGRWWSKPLPLRRARP